MKSPSVVGLALALLVIVTTSCVDDASRAIASRAVDQFHELFNAGEFLQIYESATQEFRDATAQREWIALLAAVSQKAGVVKSTSPKSSLVDSAPSAGKTVSLTYSTMFEKLTATEHFSWRVSDGVAALLGYHIDAPE